MNEALKEFQFHSVLSGGCQAAGFHCNCGLLVFKATRSWEEVHGNRASSIITKLIVLTEIQMFS